jgi:hypothetical protein
MTTFTFGVVSRFQSPSLVRAVIAASASIVIFRNRGAAGVEIAAFVTAIVLMAVIDSTANTRVGIGDDDVTIWTIGLWEKPTLIRLDAIKTVKIEAMLRVEIELESHRIIEIGPFYPWFGRAKKLAALADTLRAAARRAAVRKHSPHL